MLISTQRENHFWMLPSMLFLCCSWHCCDSAWNSELNIFPIYVAFTLVSVDNNKKKTVHFLSNWQFLTWTLCVKSERIEIKWFVFILPSFIPYHNCISWLEMLPQQPDKLAMMQLSQSWSPFSVWWVKRRDRDGENEKKKCGCLERHLAFISTFKDNSKS